MKSAAMWGRGPVERSDVESFASRIDVTASERALIIKTLAEFPADVLVRGMFFNGLVAALTSAQGALASRRLVDEASIPTSTVAFSLYPHRDFYKLFFLAAPRLHPKRPLTQAMQRVAETFYPVFRESMVGRTMSLLMGSEPEGILRRLSEAYNLCVEGNRHTVERAGGALLWHATVEPTEIYPSVFEGIVLGTFRSHHAPEPRITVDESKRDGAKQRWTLRLGW